jgi:hypothetical protein
MKDLTIMFNNAMICISVCFWIWCMKGCAEQEGLRENIYLRGKLDGATK